MMVWAILIIGGLSFIVWAHHMYVSGMNPYFGFFFATTTLIIAIPTAIKVYNWVLTLWRGNIHLTVPMLFAIGFIFTFINGGLTGLFLGNVTIDLPLSDTMFVVAHFHMVMAIAPILVVFGAIYHWYPKITGRMLDDTMGKIHFWITFVGSYAIYYPMHYLGFMGVPRRYYAIQGTNFIPESAHSLNVAITIAALVVGAAQILFLYNLISSYFRGRPSGGNPWNATTLEWQTPDTPPTHGNFGKELPVVYRWAYDYSVPGVKDDFIPQNVAPNEVAAGNWVKVARRRTAMTHHAGVSRAADGRDRLVAVPPDGQRRALERASSPCGTCMAAVLARPAAKTALWVFLAVATSLFALFISAYAMRLDYLDWTPMPQPQLLMVNTAILIVASLAMEWTAFAARRGDVERVRKGLLASGLLTVGFPGRTGRRLAAAERGWILPDDECGHGLLLSADRGARRARARRPGGMGADHGTRPAGRRYGADPAQRRACARSTGTSCWSSGSCCSRCWCRITWACRSVRRQSRCDP